MPQVDGVQLIEQLKRKGGEPIIFAITAATLGDELALLKHAGTDEVMTKPPDFAQIERLLQRYFP